VLIKCKLVALLVVIRLILSFIILFIVEICVLVPRLDFSVVKR